MFLYNIIKFNTNLGRICFCFSRVLGGVIMALEESSMFITYLYKQIPFSSILVKVHKQSPQTPYIWAYIRRKQIPQISINSFIHLFPYYTPHQFQHWQFFFYAQNSCPKTYNHVTFIHIFQQNKIKSIINKIKSKDCST